MFERPLRRSADASPPLIVEGRGQFLEEHDEFLWRGRLGRRAGGHAKQQAEGAEVAGGGTGHVADFFSRNDL